MWTERVRAAWWTLSDRDRIAVEGLLLTGALFAAVAVGPPRHGAGGLRAVGPGRHGRRRHLVPGPSTGRGPPRLRPGRWWRPRSKSSGTRHARRAPPSALTGGEPCGQGEADGDDGYAAPDRRERAGGDRAGRGRLVGAVVRVRGRGHGLDPAGGEVVPGGAWRSGAVRRPQPAEPAPDVPVPGPPSSARAAADRGARPGGCGDRLGEEAGPGPGQGSAVACCPASWPRSWRSPRPTGCSRSPAAWKRPAPCSRGTRRPRRARVRPGVRFGRGQHRRAAPVHAR